ncbi:MAG TPA: hypothetical protein VKY74_02480 [Chloroflexia bacterium]|nr:hypothetical protein [Chloroflexia bacterium]
MSEAISPPAALTQHPTPQATPAPTAAALAAAPGLDYPRLALSRAGAGRGNGGTQAATLLQLQRVVGNQAVIRARAARPPVPIQRHALSEDQDLAEVVQGAHLPSGALTADPAADTVPGATPSEEDPPIPVARMAVQREVGLAKKKARAAFVKGVQQGVGTTTPRDTFRTLMETQVNTQLAAHRVPPTPVELADLEPGERGNFHSKDWKIKLNRLRLPDPVPQDTAYDMASTAYHEARHAEQWFSIGRHVLTLLQKSGRPAVEGSLYLSLGEKLNRGVVQQVVQLNKGFDKKAKQQWAENLYTGMLKPRDPHDPNQEGRYTDHFIKVEVTDKQAIQQRMAIVGQQNQDYLTADAHPEAGIYPLAVAGWDPTHSALVAGAWQPIDTHCQTQYGTASNQEVSDAIQNLLAHDPALGKLVQTYLATYKAGLKAEVNRVNSDAAQRIGAYRGLVNEADAFQVQDKIRLKLGLAPTGIE